jgi:hypothetical protein
MYVAFPFQRNLKLGMSPFGQDPEMVVIHEDLEENLQSNTYQQEFAKIQADNSSKVQLLLSTGTHTCLKHRSFSSGDRKTSFDAVENARLLRAKLARIEEENKGDAGSTRLDDVAQTLDAKIDRTHQILVKQVDTLKEEVLTKLDVIMHHLQIQQFNHDHRHY